MNNKSSFLNAQKVKKFKLENEIKHPVLIKNLRITRNILKIVGTVVLCTGITATVLDNSHIYPFYFQEIKVPEYKQTVYTDTNVSSTYTISNSNTESLILYKYA